MTPQAQHRTVEQLATHLHTLFALRWTLSGSLYASGPDTPEARPSFHVGTIVSPCFYNPFSRSRGGSASPPSNIVADTSRSHYRNPHRGPYLKASEWLMAPIYSEIDIIRKPTAHGEEIGEDEAKTMAEGLQIMQNLLALCSSYPGDALLPIGNMSTPDRPFSLRLPDDFQLSNLMVS